MEAAIGWSGAGPAVTMLDSRMVEDSPLNLTDEVVYGSVDDDMMVAHRRTGSDESSGWDVVLVDATQLFDSVVPDAFNDTLVWAVQPLLEGTERVTSDALVERVNLRFDATTTWLLELQWSETAARSNRVPVFWPGFIAGVVISVVVGWLTAKWVERRYVEAGADASRDLIAQKDMLLLAVSHELRTPLTAVIGFLRLALGEEQDAMTTSQTRELTALALDNAELIAEITEDLLVATRIQDENLMVVIQPVELEPLIRGVFEATRDPYETLTFDQSTMDATVLADSIRLRQVVRKILEKGRVEGADTWTVTANEIGHSQDVEIIFETNTRWQITARDWRDGDVAGPGNSEIVAPRVQIALRLTELMNGYLAESDTARGTAIRLVLPEASKAPSFGTV